MWSSDERSDGPECTAVIAYSVAQWSVIPPGSCKLGKFSKVLDVKFHPLHVVGKKFEKWDVSFCNFEVECCLPFFMKMIVCLVVLRQFFLGKRGMLNFRENIGISRFANSSGIILSMLMSL